MARQLGLPFIDTDNVIERRIGCSIRDYFETQGEDAFRDVEQVVIDEATQLGGMSLPPVEAQFCAMPTGKRCMIAYNRHLSALDA